MRGVFLDFDTVGLIVIVGGNIKAFLDGKPVNVG